MQNYTLPTKQGQICKIIHPLPDDKPEESYIVLDDLITYDDNAVIHVVSITNLQRNIENPKLAPVRLTKKSDLYVVAENLESFVDSWNVK